MAMKKIQSAIEIELKKSRKIYGKSIAVFEGDEIKILDCFFFFC
jgi:hypothetical protein